MINLLASTCLVLGVVCAGRAMFCPLDSIVRWMGAAMVLCPTGVILALS